MSGFVTDVRIVHRRRSAVVAMAVVLGLGACGDDGDPAPTATDRSTTTTSEPATTTSTAPPRPTSTTTTMFDPASVEGQVEAAYLKSWDVYAEAVYNLELDEEALAEVYAEPYLSLILSEVEDRIRERRAALVRVEHDYEIQLNGTDQAVLVDRYRNHQVLIDAEAKEPIEEDPNELVIDVVTLVKVGDDWKVARIEELE